MRLQEIIIGCSPAQLQEFGGTSCELPKMTSLRDLLEEKNCVFLDKEISIQPELYLLCAFRPLQPFWTTSLFLNRKGTQFDIRYKKYITTQLYGVEFTQIHTKSAKRVAEMESRHKPPITCGNSLQVVLYKMWSTPNEVRSVSFLLGLYCFLRSSDFSYIVNSTGPRGLRYTFPKRF